MSVIVFKENFLGNYVPTSVCVTEWHLNGQTIHWNEQETQLWLTNRATHLCKCIAWLTSEKQTPFHMCYHAQFGCSSLKSVVIDRGKTPKLGSAGVQPLWVGAWLAPKNKSPPHLRYRLKFGSSASNGLCINRREPPKLGSVAGGLAVRHGWPLEIRPSPRVILLNLVVLSQQVRALLNTGRSGWKIRPLAKIFPPPCI